jgi:YD repeat-containing protein
LTSTRTFDADDNLVAEVDAQGSYNNKTRDLITLKDARGNTTGFAYAGNGNPSRITDAAGKATEVGYDSRGQSQSLPQNAAHSRGRVKPQPGSGSGSR